MGSKDLIPHVAHRNGTLEGVRWRMPTGWPLEVTALDFWVLNMPAGHPPGGDSNFWVLKI